MTVPVKCNPGGQGIKSEPRLSGSVEPLCPFIFNFVSVMFFGRRVELNWLSVAKVTFVYLSGCDA